MNQVAISFAALFSLRLNDTNLFVDSLATWIMILVFILLGISFFVKPLWAMKFTFLWIGLGNKILMGREKLPANIEKQKQDLMDENSDRYKQTIMMARLFGIWCFLIVGIYLGLKLKQ